ncbi:NAD(P)/FAD-dependent oxidoreductase [Methylocaldum sp.]|uniref:NAD(P)/FAD-dependent oxidoreductase n=1 Tax=Methylocaldum sp. TaxID=1969727 RepID=UPI002D5F33E9|nr:NAD(P)/FAD-dependent oxidoreductase [Methylocaldum sp.]HYE37473.1 NAD(P)/FAD-dependent oxidoreductase [Methylocaldum sp.]
MTQMSRRNFIKWTSTIGALGIFGCSARQPQTRLRVEKARVTVIGGGYAGASAAKYLKLLNRELEVTLVEQHAHYLSCPGSNEVIAGLRQPEELYREYDILENIRGIQTVKAEAQAIDVNRRTVILADGSAIPYDRLIVAPGIDFRWDVIEGYDETASLSAPHAWKAGKQTMLLRRQLRYMPNGGVVLITAPNNPYRCPPGPYERASLIAHFLKRHKPRSKVLILDAKTQFSKQSLFLQGWQELYPEMVEWISAEKEGKIERVDAKTRMVYTEFDEHRADVLNVIPPQKAGKLAHQAGLTDQSGWCPIDPRTFASTLVPNVHIIGDACIATPMPKSAFAANSQAKVCAVAVIELLQGREPGFPSLINHCYSFLQPDYAISITGVYEYTQTEKQLRAVSTGETPVNGDRRKEAEHARSWQKVIAADAFG